MKEKKSGSVAAIHPQSLHPFSPGATRKPELPPQQQGAPTQVDPLAQKPIKERPISSYSSIVQASSTDRGNVADAKGQSSRSMVAAVKEWHKQREEPELSSQEQAFLFGDDSTPSNTTPSKADTKAEAKDRHTPKKPKPHAVIFTLEELGERLKQEKINCPEMFLNDPIWEKFKPDPGQLFENIKRIALLPRPANHRDTFAIDHFWQLLLLAGADIQTLAVAAIDFDSDPCDVFHTTPLHYAAFCADNQTFEYIKEKSSNMPMSSKIDRSGYTVVQYAAWGGHHLRVAHYYRNCYNSCSLHFMVDSGSVEGVQYLIEQLGCKMDEQGLYYRTPLEHAAKRGHSDIVIYLLEHSRKVNSLHKERFKEEVYKVLEWAASAGQTALCELLVTRYYDEGERSIWLRDQPRKNLAYDAISFHHLDTARCLIRLGCDFRRPDKNKEGLFFKMARAGYGHEIETVAREFKLDLAAGLQVPNAKGETPLYHMARSDHAPQVLKWVTTLPIQPPLKAKIEQTALLTMAEKGGLDELNQVLQHLKEFPVQLEKTNGNSATLLHWMSHWRHKEGVMHLVQHQKLDPNACDVTRRTPLHSIVEQMCNEEEQNHQQSDYEIIQFLIAGGADPNARDSQGNTILHNAAHRGHHLMVEKLVRLGCDPRLNDGNGSILRDCAPDLSPACRELCQDTAYLEGLYLRPWLKKGLESALDAKKLYLTSSLSLLNIVTDYADIPNLTLDSLGKAEVKRDVNENEVLRQRLLWLRANHVLSPLIDLLTNDAVTEANRLAARKFLTALIDNQPNVSIAGLFVKLEKALLLAKKDKNTPKAYCSALVQALLLALDEHYFQCLKKISLDEGDARKELRDMFDGDLACCVAVHEINNDLVKLWSGRKMKKDALRPPLSGERLRWGKELQQKSYQLAIKQAPLLAEINAIPSSNILILATDSDAGAVDQYGFRAAPSVPHPADAKQAIQDVPPEQKERKREAKRSERPQVNIEKLKYFFTPTDHALAQVAQYKSDNKDKAGTDDLVSIRAAEEILKACGLNDSLMQPLEQVGDVSLLPARLAKLQAQVGRLPCYVPFVIPVVRNIGNHAVAGVIDTTTQPVTIYCIDSEMNTFGCAEDLQKQFALLISQEGHLLSGAQVKSPPLNTPPQQHDNHKCGIYTAMNLVGIILRLRWKTWEALQEALEIHAIDQEPLSPQIIELIKSIYIKDIDTWSHINLDNQYLELYELAMVLANERATKRLNVDDVARETLPEREANRAIKAERKAEPPSAVGYEQNSALRASSRANVPEGPTALPPAPSLT